MNKYNLKVSLNELPHFKLRYKKIKIAETANTFYFSVKKILIILFLLINISSASAELTLSVALYPYVPDMNSFQNAIQSVWKQRHNDVNLNFTSWDCYSDDPPKNLDVFVFDSMFLYDFIDSLMPLSKDEIENYNDLLPYSIEACTLNGIIYAVPQLLCTNLLYTRKGETQFNNMYDLYHAINVTDLTSRDSRDKGIFINSITGKTSLLCWYLLCWYLETLIDMNGEYMDIFPPLTENLDLTENKAFKTLQMLRNIAYEKTVNSENLFKNGIGSAFIGYSEAMYNLGTDFEFNLFSLSSGDNIPVFYADIAGVNSNISKEKRLLAIELLNVITSKEVLIKAVASQYLLVARNSVYDFLAKSDPVYQKLKNIVTISNSHIFTIRPSARTFLKNAKPIIEKLQ